MAAEYIFCSLTSQFFLLLRQPIKKDGLLQEPIACYEIAKRRYDFFMTYLGNHTINMTLVMVFLVGNKSNLLYIFWFFWNVDRPFVSQWIVDGVFAGIVIIYIYHLLKKESRNNCKRTMGDVSVINFNNL